MSSPRGAGFCLGCMRVCPGWDDDGFCLDVDRAELARRSHWLRTGVYPDGDEF